MSRKSWIGGNYKSAATLSTVMGMVKLLNEMGPLPDSAEVVIAPSALHLGAVKQTLRSDVGVAIQNIHTARVRGCACTALPQARAPPPLPSQRTHLTRSPPPSPPSSSSAPRRAWARSPAT
jgi:hypothetical protein